MKQQLYDNLCELNAYYDRNSRRNKMIHLYIRRQHVYATKKLIILSLMNFVENDLDTDLFKEFLEQFRIELSSMEESDLFDYVEDSFKNYLVSQIHDIDKIRNNQHFKNVRNRNRYMKEQYERFKSFKNSQNNYDNMISVLKIVQRLNAFNININIDFEFDNNEDKSMDYVKDILEYNLKDFSNLVFIL